VGEKIVHQLREEVKKEYENTIGKLEEEVKRGHIIEQYLKMDGEERFQKEMAKMRCELERAEKKIRELGEYYEQKMEKEVAKEVKRERELAKALGEECEKRLAVYQTSEERLKTVCDYIHSRRSTSELGLEGEKMIQEMCQLAFRDMEGFELKDVHTQKAKGDYHLVFKEMTVLVDSKLYTNTVSAQEREKIKRDLRMNENIHFAWLVSMDTPISKYDKGVFAFEWIAADKCVCYINSLRKNSHPVDVIRSLYFVCKILYENIVKQQDKTERKNGEEQHKISILEKYRETVVANMEKYQKIAKERDRALREIREALQNQDELIRISLNNSTEEFVDAHFSAVQTWWNTNTVECAGNVLTSQQLWSRFKRDNKEYADTISMEAFKEFLVLFVKSFTKAKGKQGKLEIHDVNFKEPAQKEEEETLSPQINDIKEEETNINPPQIAKQNRRWSHEELSELQRMYTAGKKVMEIGETLGRNAGAVLTQLKKSNTISVWNEATGYEEYRNSSGFNKFYAV
jgi:hypothetical protein